MPKASDTANSPYRRKGRKTGNQDGRKSPDPLFFLTPVDAPKNDEQDGKGCKHLILREKAVRPDETGCNIIEGKLHQSHENGDGVNTQKIFFPVVRVKKTLHDTEEEQRGGKPADPRKEQWDLPCK